jgi:hypothetical protein
VRPRQPEPRLPVRAPARQPSRKYKHNSNLRVHASAETLRGRVTGPPGIATLAKRSNPAQELSADRTRLTLLVW